MTLNAHAARLLATHQHAASQYVVGDMVEADRRLDDGQIVPRRDSVNHARRGDGADNFALPAPFVDQIAQHQGENAMRVNKIPLLIHRANPVGVAVGRQPHAPMAGLNGRHQQP